MRFLKHARKRGLALFMALVMCLSLLPVTAMAEEAGLGQAPQSTSAADREKLRNPGPVSDSEDPETKTVTIGKTAERGETPGTWDITMTMEAAQELKAVPLDLVLVIDMSGSMNWSVSSNKNPSRGEKSRLEIAKDAANKLLNSLASLNREIYVSIVTFNSNATVRRSLTSISETEDLTNTISNGLGETVNTTNITAGLRMAAGQLANTSGSGQDWKIDSLKNPDRAKAIVILSDGGPTGDIEFDRTAFSDPTKMPGFNEGYSEDNCTAAKVKDAKIEVFCVGFAADVEALSFIATDRTHYQHAKDGQELDIVFEEFKTALAAMVNDPMGDHVSISGDLQEDDGSTHRFVQSSNNKNFSWNADANHIHEGVTKTITYTVALDEAHKNDLNANAENMIDLNSKDAVFTYSVGEEASKELFFPIPKDVVDVAQLTTTYKVTDSQGKEVTVSDPAYTGGVQKGIVQWSEANASTSFAANTYEVGKTYQIDGKNYYYVGSSEVDQALNWNSDHTALTTSTPGAYTLEHTFSANPPIKPTDWNKLTIEKALTKVNDKNVVEDQVLLDGDRVTYSIVITNNTGKDLMGVKIDEIPESNLKDLNVTGANKDTDGKYVVGAIKNGETATVTVSATVEIKADQSSGKISSNAVNKVEITDATDPEGGKPDPNDPPSSETEDPVAHKITKFTKKRVTDEATVKDLGLTGINTDETILRGSEDVTLLYALTVSGTPGATFKVSDQGATLVGTDPSWEGVIPSDGKDVVIYVTKTFTTSDASITNVAYVTAGGKDDNEIPTVVEEPDGPKDPTDPNEPKDPNAPEDPYKKAEETTDSEQAYTITVKYVDDKGNDLAILVDGKYISEQTTGKLSNGTDYMAEVKTWIYSEAADEAGNHYVLDVKPDGTKYVQNVTVTAGKTDDGKINGEDVEITVVYTLDNWDRENPETPDPEDPGDKTPDKYQVKVIYKVKGTETRGWIDQKDTTIKTEIINLGTGTNPYKTQGDVKISGAAGVAAAGSKFNVWSQELKRDGDPVADWTGPLTGTGAYSAQIAPNTVIKDAHGLDVYTFTASFQELGTYDVTYKFVITNKDGDEMTDPSLKGAIASFLPEDQTLRENETAPAAPTAPDQGKVVQVEGGYLKFESWAKTDKTDPNDKNIEYVGTWVYRENTPLHPYSLTYVYDNGQDNKVIKVDSALEEHTFTVEEADPKKDGFIFKGWKRTATAPYLWKGETVKATVENPAITLTAQWEPEATYTVTYDWEGSAPKGVSLPKDTTAYRYGQSFTPSPVPSLGAEIPVYYGYGTTAATVIGTWTFEGWQDPPETITKNETVLGKWHYEAAPATGKVNVTKTPDKTVANVGDTVTWTITVENPRSGRNYTGLNLKDILDGASIPGGDLQEAIGYGWYTDPGYYSPEDPVKSVYTLTINYVDEEGNVLAAPHIENLPAGTEYAVTSPEIEGYVADQLTVTGTMCDVMNPTATNPGEDTTVTVVYTLVDPEEADPEMTDPEEADPEMTDPEEADPEMTDSEETDPEEADPEEADPQETDPKETDPKETDPEMTDLADVYTTEVMVISDAAAGLDPQNFDLAPGAVAVFEVSYKVQPGDGKELVNHATVIDPKDPDRVGYGDSEPVKVLHPDLEVVKIRTSAATVRVGETITWTITITNKGDGTAYDVVVEDANADTLSESSFTSIEPGERREITATHRVTGNETLAADGKFYNTVVVSYKEDPKDPSEKPKETEDTDEGTEIVIEEPAVRSLTVTKAASVRTVYAGGRITYTITVTNNTGRDVADVTVTDVLDDDLTFVSAALDGTSITPAGSVYAIGGLANGTSATLTIEVRVDSDVPANTVIRNVATAREPVSGSVSSDPANVRVVEPSPRPDPDPDPYDPPYTPTPTPTPIPDTPTPLDPGDTINDQDVPLAGTVGLNDVDHFAYVIGYPDDTVHPLANITRAEAATIFFRLMTEEYRSANWSTSNDFSDVKAGDWYNNAISTCARAGVVKGYEDGTFRPNAPITRAEFAAMAAGFMDESITDEGVGDFSDTADHWAASAIRRAAKAGWVTGDGNRFRPNDNITRAEVMTIVNRMLDRTPDKDHMLPDMKKWSDNPEDAWYYEAVQEATNEHDYERDEAAVETWTLIKEHRDWAALELGWAANNGASAPATETEAETQSLPDGI